MRFIKTLPLVFLISLAQANAQSSLALDQIRAEGFQNSQVKEILNELSDLYGPRLTGSDQYYRAAEWTREKINGWELDDVHFEPFCTECRGWEVNSFNVEMIEPSYMSIIAYPMAWTRSSKGEVVGEIAHIPSEEDLDSLRQEFKGKLTGKVVLFGSSDQPDMLFDPMTTRFSQDQLQKAISQTDPIPDDPIGFMAREPVDKQVSTWAENARQSEQFYKWLDEEGAIGILESSHRFPGIAHPSGTAMYKTSQIAPIPYFSIAPEHFGRILRLLDRDITPKIRFHLETEIYHKPENNVNIIAELKGTDRQLQNEVVMIGGHFDSWHAGTGATDNGSGTAVMMEVMRILKSTGVELKRTVKLGLWGGEEQGFRGSLDYAREHFGAWNESRKPEVEQISAYLNMDNGAGTIRGIYLQGNEAVRPIFQKMLGSFDSLEVNNLTIQNADYTDHDVLDSYGIPAFQFIQDPLNYMSVTHHTTMDLPEYAPEEDLKKNAVIIASLVYQIANLEEKMPRK